MKIRISNLGHVQYANISLADFTVVCGSNNTGKTYLTYVIYGFLSYWWEAYELDLNDNTIELLLENGNVSVSLKSLLDKSQHFVNDACNRYSRMIKNVLSIEQESIAAAKLKIEVDSDDMRPMNTFDLIMGTKKGNVFSVYKDRGSDKISISLLVDRESIEIPKRVLAHSISDAIKRIIFANTFAMPTLLVAERTGIEIFQAELDFARNRILDTLKEEEGMADPFMILKRVNKDYAMPINRAVDAVRRISDTVKNQSYIAEKHPHIIESMNRIIGGDVVYSNNNKTLLFVPSNNKRVKLRIKESSSSVRSLVNLVIYLKHSAQKGDLLMIDEPELNLHPENQRLLMRLFAQMINVGIRIYITTHSDYIVKELNNLTLIATLPSKEKFTLLKKYGYDKTEIISKDKSAVYIASREMMLVKGNTRRTRCNTFKEAEYGFAGFELDEFDNAINEMNEIQDHLIYGDH